MNRDPLDEQLRALGKGTPFPVDWEAYERRLLARLAGAQARRMRRTAAIGVIGALAGAAATLALSWTLASKAAPHADELAEARPPRTSAAYVQPAVAQNPGDPPPAVFRLTRGGMSVFMPAAADPAGVPAPKTAGRKGTIRFDGFCEPDPKSETGFIVEGIHR